jgi:Tfp pilus assembly pilus retraction ATPase PilT
MTLQELYDSRDRIQAQIEALRIFPKTKTVRQLLRELKEKLVRIEERISELEGEQEEEEELEPEDEDEDADLDRSKGMKKYHRYIRLIHDNYPEYSYSDIRSMLAQRKRGKDVDIPDVVWQNPSP